MSGPGTFLLLDDSVNQCIELPVGWITDWGLTMVREIDNYTYRVTWSKEDEEFVDHCAEFPIGWPSKDITCSQASRILVL